MSPPRIFVATPIHEPQRRLLDPAPSNHLLRVLRLRPPAAKQPPNNESLGRKRQPF